MDSVLFSLSAFLLSFSFSLLELECHPFSISLLTIVLALTEQDVGFFMCLVRWLKVCQAFLLKWLQYMNFSLSFPNTPVSYSALISLSVNAIHPASGAALVESSYSLWYSSSQVGIRFLTVAARVGGWICL